MSSRTRTRLTEALGATDVALTAEQLDLIEAAAPAEHMAALDSER